MLFERGSEWRRWDLHIHTPGTQKNDLYEGKSIEEKWECYYEAIKKYVGDGKDDRRNVTVIGVTDYLSIDNYKKIISDNRLPKSIQLVLPNVEMRIIPIAAKKPINIHFIFEPSIVNELEERFFGKIFFDNGTRKFTAARGELINLGISILGNANKEEAYRKGIEQFVPTMDGIKEVFKNDPELREKTLIGITNGSGDGVSGAVNNESYLDEENKSSQLTAVRQSLYKFADFIFSSNARDIEYFLGMGVDSEEEVKQKCGSLKPCLHGSDAHCIEKLFEPDEKRYCWIKADPTFNGLRQIIYEPKARVKISTLKPETKVGYHVIEHVEINNDDFDIKPICFNDKLTCIIGGKSTGKSMLLHNLANAIDKKQVKEKIETSKNSTKEIKSFKVFWADGTISESGEADSAHKIVYIPQTYLNRLSDENEETTEIDIIIQDIILLNQKCKEAYDEMKLNIQNFKPSIDKQIYDLLQVYGFMQESKKALDELGTKDGIEKEIEKLKNEKDKISKEYAISEEDVKKYDASIKQIAEYQNHIKKIDTDIEQLLQITKIVMPIDIKHDFAEEVKIEIREAINIITHMADKEWEKLQEDIVEKLKIEKEELYKKLVESIKIRDSLSKQVSENEALNLLSKRIEAEEEKLLHCKELDDQYVVKRKQYDELIENLSNVIGIFREFHNRYVQVINNNFSTDSDGLYFFACMPFKNEAFSKYIRDSFDKRILKTKKDIIDLENFKIENFTNIQLASLLNACIKEEIPLVKGQTVESVLRNILDNWFNITYSVQMDNDTIEEMSPGKKALVLLKLLINMADSKCPILIDQPEDDLDNRSIYKELIPFIKEKKLERQIIIVTHNANVVLGGDAEEIIVANQAGNNSPNRKYRFEYCSGSIENNIPIFNASGDIVPGILNQQGIQQHICDILEGGEKAFDLRKNKYRI